MRRLPFVRVIVAKLIDELHWFPGKVNVLGMLLLSAIVVVVASADYFSVVHGIKYGPDGWQFDGSAIPAPENLVPIFLTLAVYFGGCVWIFTKYDRYMSGIHPDKYPPPNANERISDEHPPQGQRQIDRRKEGRGPRQTHS